jgi:ABC-2 type transport system permease protein
MSGVSWPVNAIPDWLVGLSKIFPGTTAIPAYLRLRTMGVSLLDVKSELIFLYIQAAIYTSLTIIYFFTRVKVKAKKTTSHNQTIRI